MRTDIHRPSAIIPEDYTFVAFAHVKIDGIGDAYWAKENRERITAHMARTGGKYSNHEHGGSCAVCGSVNAIYTALFHHSPTNTYLHVGSDCTDQLDAGIAPAFRNFKSGIRDAREAQKGKQKAALVLQDAGASWAWELYTRDYMTHPSLIVRKDENGEIISTTLPYEETTVLDIVGKLVKYGSISERTMQFLLTLQGKIETRAQREAERTIEREAAAPCPTGRVVVTGEVLSVKEHTNDFRVTLKMTVKAAEGYIVWVSVPSSIAVERGQKITFKATLTPSPNDPKFGFGKRPVAA